MYLKSTSPWGIDLMPLMPMQAQRPLALPRMPTHGPHKIVHRTETQSYKGNQTLPTPSMPPHSHLARLGLHLTWYPIPRCYWQSVGTDPAPNPMAKLTWMGPTLSREDGHPLGLSHQHNPPWMAYEWDTSHGKNPNNHLDICPGHMETMQCMITSIKMLTDWISQTTNRL